MLKEELLHFLWKTRRVDLNGLQTTDGEPVQILKIGIHNHNAGPDFLNGKARIGNTEWNGHIEFHLKSSDWNNHKHQEDARYNNVILHVVYDDNKQVLKENGHQIPTLEIQHLIDHNAYYYYEQFQL